VANAGYFAPKAVIVELDLVGSVAVRNLVLLGNGEYLSNVEDLGQRPDCKKQHCCRRYFAVVLRRLPHLDAAIHTALRPACLRAVVDMDSER